MHDVRDPAHVPAYVDAARSHLNDVLIEPARPGEVRAEIERNRKDAGQQKLRADAQCVTVGLISFSEQAQPIVDKLSREEQNAAFQRAAEAIARHCNRPLLGLVVHRDESATHAHFMLRAYAKDAQGREQSWRFSKSDMSRAQDAGAEAFGHGIVRGVPKAERIARGDPLHKIVHRSVRELHEALPRELKMVEERLADRKKKLAESERKIELPKPKTVEIVEGGIGPFKRTRSVRVIDATALKQARAALAQRELEISQREEQAERLLRVVKEQRDAVQAAAREIRDLKQHERMLDKLGAVKTARHELDAEPDQAEGPKPSR